MLSPKSCCASIKALPLHFAPLPLALDISRMFDASLVSASLGEPSETAGIVPKIPLSTAISSFCKSLTQKSDTRLAIAAIGSAPDIAAERSVALHIFARLKITATSFLLLILSAVRSSPSITVSDSPVRSEKNGIFTSGLACDASLSNSASF